MAIEPVNERPIFPQLLRADSQNVSYWSTSMIRQLTTVFQQYGYRLNRTLLAGGLTTNANTLSASGGYVLTENAVGTPVADTPNIAVLHADTSTSDNPLRRGATQIAFVTDGAAPATYRRARNNDAAALDDWGAWVRMADEAELADVLRDADRASQSGNLAETDNDNTFTGTQTVENPVVLAGGGWHAATLQNGWENYGGSFSDARYRKLASGLVVLTGLVRNGSGMPLFTLPTGYRPDSRLIFSGEAQGDGSRRVDVGADGNVGHSSLPANNWISLDGISFYADQ